MKIGLLSETHGHVERSRIACERLLEEGVDALCHCGDVGSEQVLIEMAGVLDGRLPAYVILGNVDLWDRSIQQFPDTTGIHMMGQLGKLQLCGKKMALAHGHEPRTLDAAVFSGEYDYVFTGHTHIKEDRSVGQTRVINPGAVYRALENTVAVLDLETEALRFIVLDFSD